MHKLMLLTQREIIERFNQKGFWYMLFFGPLVVLLLLVVLLKAADQGKQEIKVLIADPGQIMAHRLMAQEEKNLHYFFIDDYLELTEFQIGKAYQEFDVLLELNEKVLNNKKCFVRFLLIINLNSISRNQIIKRHLTWLRESLIRPNFIYFCRYCRRNAFTSTKILYNCSCSYN